MKKLFIIFFVFSAVLGSQSEFKVAKIVRKISEKALRSPKEFQRFKDMPMQHDVSTVDRTEPVTLEGDPTGELELKLELKEIKDFQEAASGLSKEIRDSREKLNFVIQDACKKSGKDIIELSRDEVIKLAKHQQAINEKLLDFSMNLSDLAAACVLLIDCHIQEAGSAREEKLNARKLKMEKLDKQLSI